MPWCEAAVIGTCMLVLAELFYGVELSDREKSIVQNC